MSFTNEDGWEEVRRIPKGAVLTYGDIAERLGGSRRTHGRAVGQALSAAPDDVPWWRVVRWDGSMRRPADPEQIRRLRAEGVKITPDGRVSCFCSGRRLAPQGGTSMPYDPTRAIC